MDRTISRFSTFMSLKLSNTVVILFLFALQLVFVFFGYQNYSPVYILFATLIAPFLLSLVLDRGQDKKKDSQKKESYPELRKKLGYSDLKYQCQSYTFLMTVILLILWHFRMRGVEAVFSPASSMPVLTLFIYAAVRIAVWLFYLILFRFFPFKAFK
ncbi:MAG: hypothetical protein J6U42_00180 [Lachnospiraceae bacterium]|nr:hypothetical protein [Lachnospiraceae bacterium]